MRAMRIATDVRSLCEVSARIGRDPLLIQGPGGNTSLKIGGVLWVKASGLWLAEALERPIFARLSLSAFREALADGQADPQDGQDDLRPSIETAMHALMPHAAVIHAHAVNSMAISVLADGASRAARALGDLNWAWIAYHRPGAPLAAAVSLALARGAPDVLLLQNHGVVVGAPTPSAAEALLQDVETRLRLKPRALPSADLDGLAGRGGPDYEPAAEFCGLALDADLRRLVTAAALVPDQVVFLGGALPATAPGETVETAVRRVQAETSVAPAFMLETGVGVFAARRRSRGARSLMGGLCEIVRRIPHGAEARGLSPGAVAELLRWEPEGYRRDLDANRV